MYQWMLTDEITLEHHEAPTGLDEGVYKTAEGSLHGVQLTMGGARALGRRLRAAWYKTNQNRRVFITECVGPSD